jgi:phosphoesterase RecJ-like protein
MSEVEPSGACAADDEAAEAAGEVAEWSRALVEAADRLAAASSVLVTCHRTADGDALGSMVALAALLRERGKRTVVYVPDLVPRRFHWLPNIRSASTRLAAGERFDVTAVLDCGDAEQLARPLPEAVVTGPVIVFDHHASGRPFGDLFVADPAAASVGVLVARLARRLGWPLGRDAALGLFVSLSCDTGSFRYANADAEAFALAAELVAAGVQPYEVTEQLHERNSLARCRLLAAALAGIELHADGRIAVMTITLEMVKQSGATWDDTVGMVNYVRGIDGVECGVLLTPAKRGGTRVSLRSRGRRIDAGAVCLPFGGGGHPGAAGCTLPAELADARATILGALAAALGPAGGGAAPAAQGG